MENLSIEEHFAEYGWAYVPNLVDKYECEMLTKHLFTLKNNGKLRKDNQCPLSLSVYGEPLLDKFLELNRSKISDVINIPLLPTYTYSRLYQKNDNLRIHVDRPSCEISVTITLGHDKNSDIWPIFFSKSRRKGDAVRQIIEVGDGVIYRGMDLAHWREKYKGNWQTQIFLHYVNANGQNADLAYDGRAKLGDRKRIKTVRD